MSYTTSTNYKHKARFKKLLDNTKSGLLISISDKKSIHSIHGLRRELKNKNLSVHMTTKRYIDKRYIAEAGREKNAKSTLGDHLYIVKINDGYDGAMLNKLLRKKTVSVSGYIHDQKLFSKKDAEMLLKACFCPQKLTIIALLGILKLVPLIQKMREPIN